MEDSSVFPSLNFGKISLFNNLPVLFLKFRCFYHKILAELIDSQLRTSNLKNEGLERLLIL